MPDRSLPSRLSRTERADDWQVPGGDLLDWLASPEATDFKVERDTLILAVPIPDGAAFAKLYRVPPHLRWRTLLTRSRARREWRSLRALEAAGIPCTPALAFAEDRSAGLLRSSLLVTRAVESAADLRQRAVQSGAEAWMEAAGAALGLLHNRGFVHFRALPRNLLGVDAPEPAIAFLDTPYTLQFSGPVSALGRRIDLEDMLAELPSELHEAVLLGYGDDAPPGLSPNRSARHRKFRRIASYLLWALTGHRPTR